MRVLITGGTGFIGSRLALKCLEDGQSVRVLGQENTQAERENRTEIEDAGADVVLGSVEDADAIAPLFEDTQVVFHLAAAQHEMNISDQRFWDVNVAGTRNVLEAAGAAGVGRFVHGSTIGVYGKPQGPIDEASPCRPANIYGVTKLEAEKAVRSAAVQIDVVIVRIPEVYGPGDRRLLKLFRTIQKKAFFVIGDGKNLHHPIYIDDLVEALLAAGRNPAAVGETLQLSGKEALTTEQMVRTIADCLGVRPKGLKLPMFPFLWGAYAMEAVFRPLGLQPPLHRRRLDFFRKSFLLNGGKAEQRLGFAPRVSFEQGAAQTSRWYKERGLLG